MSTVVISVSSQRPGPTAPRRWWRACVLAHDAAGAGRESAGTVRSPV